MTEEESGSGVKEMSEGLKRDYQIGAEIGRGRFGIVSRSSSKATGEIFAVKTLHKALLSGDALERECLEKEAKLHQLVNGHPHIVGLRGVYEDDETLSLVLDFCPSPDLFDQISGRGGSFLEEEAKALMRPLMEAIAHCHRRGVAHRDIKPDNVLFDSWGRLKLADFGSADWFGDGRPLSGIVGTPYYVAPEVLSGRDYGEKVDVWSAGVILYLLLAGTLPFRGESAVEIFEAVMRGNLRFPTRIFLGVSAEAKDLLRRMICKDVSRRLSAEQVLSTSSLFFAAFSLDLYFCTRNRFSILKLSLIPFRFVLNRASVDDERTRDGANVRESVLGEI